MGRTDQEKLDNLEQAILVAQNKLADINAAINRDTLIAEQKKSDANNLSKQIETLNKQTEEVNKSRFNVQATLSSAQEIHNANLISMDNERHSKQGLLDALDVTISGKQLELAKLEKVWEQKNQELLANYTKDETNLSVNISKIKEENTRLLDINGSLKLEGVRLEGVRRDAQIKLDGINNSIGLQQSILNGYEDKITQAKSDYVVIAKQEGEANNQLTSAQTQLEQLKPEILDLTNQRDALKLEVDNKNKEVDQFIKDKLQLKSDQDALVSKEIFIKEKFEQAGLVYN